jgi:hypothetical protein
MAVAAAGGAVSKVRTGGPDLLWSVGMGVPPAKLYEKLASWQWRRSEVGMTVKKSRSLVCLTLEHAALLRE